jgi:hypothetical protein
MAQAVNCWPLTAEAWACAQVSLRGVCSGQSGTGQVFLLLVTPMLHTHPAPPHKMCNSPDQAAHYHTLGPKLGASSVTWHFVGLRVK